MTCDLEIAERRLQWRTDLKFRSGVELLRRVEKAKQSGQIKGYTVLYCNDDPAVVDSVLIDK